METLLSMLYPLLPRQTVAILDSLSPLLSLLTSPTRLIYTAYSHPADFFNILQETYSRLSHALRGMDFSGSNAWQTLLPFVIGGFGVYMALMSMMRTFRGLTTVVMGLIRWSWLIGGVVTLLGWFLGGGRDAQGGGAGGVPAVIGSLISGLTGFGGQNNGGGYGNLGNQAQGIFSSMFGNNDANKAGGYSSRNSKQRSANSWDNLKSQTKASTRRKPAAQTDDPLSNIFSSFTGGQDAGPGGVAGYAQRWAKNAFLRASGLDGLFGDGQAQTEADATRAKKKRAHSR